MNGVKDLGQAAADAIREPIETPVQFAPKGNARGNRYGFALDRA
jgi:hypothetical protein